MNLPKSVHKIIIGVTHMKFREISGIPSKFSYIVQCDLINMNDMNNNVCQCVAAIMKTAYNFLIIFTIYSLCFISLSFIFVHKGIFFIFGVFISENSGLYSSILVQKEGYE